MSLYLTTVAASLSVKVGYTSNLDNRAKAYSTTNPDFIGFDDTCNGSMNDEKRIHAFFDRCENLSRVNNTEWYRCADEYLFKMIKTNGLKGIKDMVSYSDGKMFESLEDVQTEETSYDDFDSKFCAKMAKKVSSENTYVNKRTREIKSMIMEKASKGGNHVRTSISKAQGAPVVAWLRNKGFEVYCTTIFNESDKRYVWEEGTGEAVIYW